MSEEPIYNSTGWVIGWIVGNIIYDWSGQGRAFIEGSNIFAPEAEYLGEFSDGFFRDHAGDAVAFIEGARSGPSLPATRQPSPELPELLNPPAEPTSSLQSGPPSGSQRWSENSWNSYLCGWRPYRIADKYR